MPRRKFPAICLILVAAVNVGVIPLAAAQRGSNEGSPLRHGFELSTRDRAQSNPSARDDGFVVIRGASETSTLDRKDNVDNLISLGYKGIWSSETGLWRTEAPGFDDEDSTIYYTMRHDDFRLGFSVRPDPSSDRDGIIFAADYDRRFDSFRLGLKASYVPTDTPSDFVVPDLGAWTVGARFNVGGLLVAGEIRRGIDPGDDAAAAAPGWDEEWNLGARYRWGHNDIRLAFAYSENRPDPTVEGDDKLDAATVSYARKFTGGVEWSINLHWADRDATPARGLAGPDGTSLSTAVRWSF